MRTGPCIRPTTGLLYEHMFVTRRIGAEDLAGLSDDELEEEVAAQAASLDAGLCRFVELAAECERRLPVGGDGVTFAGWLAWRCSLSPRQAREHARIGARLAELPRIREAFARGQLSYAKVSVLTRIAESESEARLVELAEALTASQLERAAGAYRRLTREEAAEQQEREFLNYHWTEKGALSLRAQLAAEDGALVLRALDAGRDALWQQDHTHAETEADPVEAPARPTNAEALVAMADLALTSSQSESSGAERHQIVVHVDAQVLARDGDGRCELADGHALAAETARRLACDSSIVDLVERDGEPLALGRKRRTLSPALRRALAVRDRRCRFPGCNNSRFVEAHHLEHWSQGGRTDLDNLISLCRRHHRLVHERGYTVSLDNDGEAQFTNNYGITLPNVPRSPPSLREALRNRHRPLLIDAKTTWTGRGDRMQLDLAVDAIAAAPTKRSGTAPAPTP